jgi:lactoylglutathione lyase
MKLVKAGIILFAHHYSECVSFYRDQLGLPFVSETPELTVLAFDQAYLMIEKGGAPSSNPKSRSQNPTVLRFNVADVHEAADELRAKGIAVDVKTFPWGVMGGFSDPDGNRCELKDPF